MKIKMLTVAAGPTGIKYQGFSYEVSEDEGRAMIKGGYATEMITPEVNKVKSKETKVIKPVEVKTEVPTASSKKNNIPWT